MNRRTFLRAGSSIAVAGGIGVGAIALAASSEKELDIFQKVEKVWREVGLKKLESGHEGTPCWHYSISIGLLDQSIKRIPMPYVFDRHEAEWILNRNDPNGKFTYFSVDFRIIHGIGYVRTNFYRMA